MAGERGGATRPGTLAVVGDALWVGIGGFCGANARYWLGRWVAERVSTSFPSGTLLINVSGSLLIGILMILLTERLNVDPAWRLLLVVGFLGAVVGQGLRGAQVHGARWLVGHTLVSVNGGRSRRGPRSG